jgi:hypothetical protein
MDRARPTRQNRPVRRRAFHRGFALLQALPAGCVVAWAGVALLPTPDGPLRMGRADESGQPSESPTPADPPATTPPSSPTPSPQQEPPADTPDGAETSGADGPDPLPDEGIREVVVTLTSGREIVGALVSESDEAVVVRINGIDTTLPRVRVAGIRELPPVTERYVELRRTVDDDNIRARLALVEWLRAREAYRLALRELEGILEIEPANPDARTLHTWLENHLRLAARARPARREARPVAPAPGVPLLSEAEVNLIRVYEIDLGKPGRVIVPDDVMRELMARHPESFPVSFEEREAVLKAGAGEKVRMLFESKARDLYGRVRVLDDPPTMAQFKSRVGSGWLMNACASNRCHGGADAGRLRLYNQRPNSDRTAYTNMLILDRFVLADGTPLINYENPDRSPLLHMGLPDHASLFPHPEVDRERIGQDWRFVFRNPTDRAFRQTVEWIGTLYTPRPDYGIEYPPGSDGDADQPDTPPEPAEPVETSAEEPPPEEVDPFEDPSPFDP